MSSPAFSEKFIAFVDILGFKSLVAEAEKGENVSLDDVIALTKELGGPEKVERYRKHGPRLCPQSAKISNDVAFALTQVSDCVIISTEISPAGLISLVQECWDAAFGVLHKGYLSRGYITRGSIYHTESNLLGSGYKSAYQSESSVQAFKLEADERGTPFIEIDPEVTKYAMEQTDNCVVRMFDKMTETKDGTTAIYPFKVIGQDVIFGGAEFCMQFVDRNRDLEQAHHIQESILNYKKRLWDRADRSRPDVIQKLNHYTRALNEKLLHSCEQELSIIHLMRKELLAKIATEDKKTK